MSYLARRRTVRSKPEPLTDEEIEFILSQIPKVPCIDPVSQEVGHRATMAKYRKELQCVKMSKREANFQRLINELIKSTNAAYVESGYRIGITAGSALNSTSFQKTMDSFKQGGSKLDYKSSLEEFDALISASRRPEFIFVHFNESYSRRQIVEMRHLVVSATIGDFVSSSGVFLLRQDFSSLTPQQVSLINSISETGIQFVNREKFHYIYEKFHQTSLPVTMFLRLTFDLDKLYTRRMTLDRIAAAIQDGNDHGLMIIVPGPLSSGIIDIFFDQSTITSSSNINNLVADSEMLCKITESRVSDQHIAGIKGVTYLVARSYKIFSLVRQCVPIVKVPYPDQSIGKELSTLVAKEIKKMTPRRENYSINRFIVTLENQTGLHGKIHYIETNRVKYANFDERLVLYLFQLLGIQVIRRVVSDQIEPLNGISTREFVEGYYVLLDQQFPDYIETMDPSLVSMIDIVNDPQLLSVYANNPHLLERVKTIRVVNDDPQVFNKLIGISILPIKKVNDIWYVYYDLNLNNLYSLFLKKRQKLAKGQKPKISYNYAIFGGDELKEILLLPFVNRRRTYSSNLHILLENYGVIMMYREMVRRVSEIVSADDPSSLNLCYVTLMAKCLTQLGNYEPITSNHNIGPITTASLKNTTGELIEAARSRGGESTRNVAVGNLTGVASGTGDNAQRNYTESLGIYEKMLTEQKRKQSQVNNGSLLLAVESVEELAGYLDGYSNPATESADIGKGVADIRLGLEEKIKSGDVTNAHSYVATNLLTTAARNVSRYTTKEMIAIIPRRYIDQSINSSMNNQVIRLSLSASNQAMIRSLLIQIAGPPSGEFGGSEIKVKPTPLENKVGGGIKSMLLQRMRRK